MRLTHVAASVNQWLARAAFERDAWDERLREASREAGFYQIAAVALVARGALAVTRRVLALMLSLGHSMLCRHEATGPDAPEVQLASQVRLEALSLANSLRATAVDVIDALAGLGPPTGDPPHPPWLDTLAADLAWARNVVPPEMVLVLYGRIFDFAQRVNARLIELAQQARHEAVSAGLVRVPGAPDGHAGDQ
jgi:hypothetical protein